MIYTIFACFIKRPPISSSEAVYRDELVIKKPPHPTIMTPPPSCKASSLVKKSVRFADSEPAVIIFGDHDEKKDDDDNNNLVKGIRCGEEKGGGIRVKVKMTKEEAARLLSKCKLGGQLDFNDVARQLVALPINRVSVVSTTTCSNNC